MRAGDDLRERALLRDAKHGDPRAREQLVREHEHMVRATASRYRGLGLPFEDILQEGLIGVLAAIDSYDATRGASFETFARSHVRHAITDALTSQARLVRLPKQVVERRRAVTRVSSELAALNGHLPTPDEIEAEIGVRADSVEALQALPVAAASLDEQIAGDGATMLELVEDPAASDPEAETLALHRSALIAEALERLPARERLVIERRFGFGRPAASLTEVSGELHLCPQRTRSIEQTALLRLAKMLERDPTFQRPVWSEWTFPLTKTRPRRAPSSRSRGQTRHMSSPRRRRAPAPRAIARR